MYQTMEQHLKEVIAERIEKTPGEVELSHNLKADYGLNSLDVVEIFFIMENHYGITIPDDKIEAVRTVGDIYYCLMDRVPQLKAVTV